MGQSLKIKESMLYNPVKEYFQFMGYEVKGEVKQCDVMAVKEDVIIIIEMKTTLNLEVILQASIRQRMTDFVYIAVPKKRKTMSTKRWKNICYLLRRLEIGLLVINFKESLNFVQEIFPPQPFSKSMSQKLSQKKRMAVINEFRERHGDYNLGGVSQTKIITAYKEMAIHIAVILREHKSLSIKQLRTMGTDSKKTATILQKNYYNWFKRIDRGVYSITEKGKKELNNYNDLVKFYQKTLNTNK